jgi:hypothetical protein
MSCLFWYSTDVFTRKREASVEITFTSVSSNMIYERAVASNSKKRTTSQLYIAMNVLSHVYGRTKKYEIDVLHISMMSNTRMSTNKIVQIDSDF